MEQVLLDQITALRAQLHACAEVSGREVVTKHTLLTFLREHTSLELHELAGGFYAAHREPEGTKPTVALRADYDALATPEGGAAHLCGHDGHAAALCGVALMLEGQSIGRSVFLLFQGAEETGAGAALCCELFDREKVGEIYGAHNLPGFPFGAVLTRAGTFACASRGVTIHFVGKPAHAAYPETGISPAPAVGQLLVDLPALAALAAKLFSGDEAEHFAEFSQLLPCADAALFLCEEGGAPAGFAQAQLRRDYVEGSSTSPVGYLEGVYVEPDFRRRGFAQALLRACEAWARERGCAEFASDCELENEASAAFHARMGFAEVNRIRCFLKPL